MFVKNQIKKSLAVVLAAVMLFGALTVAPFTISAAETSQSVGASSGTTGDCTWTLDDDGVLTISGNGAMGDDYSPWGKSITSVIIESGVTSIGRDAFCRCSKLTRVSIPNSVTSIGREAFYRCSELTRVSIPNSVTSIGEDAFFNCAVLTSVIIPDSVTSIGDDAFYGTAWFSNQPDGLVYAGKVAYKYKGEIPYGTSVEIKIGTKGIADNAFCNRGGLSSVSIPYSVMIIGEYAFFGCTDLTNLTIPNSVTNIGERAFQSCTGLTSVTIPNSVTSISNYAFGNCTGLKSVTIPDSVTSIGEAAFFNCAGLTSVIIPDNVTSIGDSAFSSCTGLKSVTIPDSVTTIGWYAFKNCTGLTSVTIPDSVASIGWYAFENCTGLTSVTIPNSLTYISLYMFKGCTGLTSVTIPDSVGDIGQNAFEDCTGLISVIIPNSVRRIENYAFRGCTGLTSVTIPDSVSDIYWHAFNNCPQLTDVYYGGNESQWKKIYIDSGNDYLKSATIHYNSTGALSPVNTNSVAVKTSSGSTLNIELEKDLSFTVPSNVPLIGGKAMKLDLSFVPLTAAVTENSIKIGIGYNRDLTADTDEQTWCNWKNYVKGYKDAVSQGTELFGDVVNKKKGIASAGMGVDFDFEFYGYFEGTIQNGEITGSGTAKIKLEAALKNQWQTAIGFVPIVIKFQGKIGVENTATLSLNFSTKKISFTDQLDITLPQIIVSAGIGIAHVADISVYGDAKNVFSIYSNPKRVTGTLLGELGVSATALFWTAKVPLISAGSGWMYYDSSRKSGSSSVGAFGYDDWDFTIDRSYLKKQSGWLNGNSKVTNPVGASGYDAFTYTTLQTSIYDGAAPKLVKTDDDLILVWIGDDQTRSDGNQTVVYYSVYDSGSSTWNAPTAVEDNGTADFTPELATDGENTYLAWTDAKTIFDGNAEMSEVAAACEIKLAKFNATTKQFGDVVQLTDNNTLDISPNPAIRNGSVSVVWKNNSANAILENAGTETVYKATKIANGFTTTAVYPSPNKIYEFVTDGENIVVSVDGDGSLTDVTDSEIFAVNSQNTITKLTENASGENNLAFSSINGQTMLTYLCDGRLYGSADLETVNALSDTDAMIFGKYQFVGNKLFSVENIEGSAEIFSYSINEEGLWSNPVQVSFTEKYIRNPAFVDNNGEIDCVFLNTSAVISDEDVSETTDLCTSVIPDFHSIEIEDISYDSDSVVPGGNVPVTITLRNNGTVSENAFNITVLDENGTTVVNASVSKDVKSGQTAELAAEIPLDSSLNSKKTYTVTVNGTNCDDSDELSIGYTQLMLTTKTGIQDDTLGVLLNITNDSAIPTTARLVVKASENAEKALDIFTLGEIGANTSLNYYLNNEKICAYKAQTDILYLEIVSGKDEISIADNTASVGLSLFSQYQLGDTNTDGVINIRDVTAIQRHVAEIELLTEEQYALADTNDDGKVDIDDATHLQMYLAEYDVVLGKQS